MEDSNFIIPKLLYVFLYSLYGSALAYISLFYREALFLDSQQIGILLAIAPFVQIVACPMWTSLVDRYSQLHGPIMGILASIGGSSVLVLNYLPIWVDVQDSSLVMRITCLCAFLFAFFGSPVCALVDSVVLKILRDQKILYGNQRLWGSVSSGFHILTVGLFIERFGISSAFTVFLVGLVMFVVVSMFIPYQMNQAETHDTDHEEETDSLLENNRKYTGNYMYNPSLVDRPSLSHRPTTSTTTTTQRRESTVYVPSHMLSLTTTSTTWMANMAQDEASQELNEFESIFPPLGLVLSTIPTIDTSLSALGQPLEEGRNELPEKSIFGSVLVYSFFVSICLYGLAHSMISQFLFLLLKDLGMSSLLIGCTGALGGLAEVATFWFSRQLFEKYSVQCLMTIAYLSFVFRALTYTCLSSHESKSIVIALLLQIVNGFVYALVWSISVAEVDSFFPIEQKSIAQGILAALLNGLGYGLGCILGGYIYGVYGSVKLFQVSSFICFISLTVFLCGRRPTF